MSGVAKYSEDEQRSALRLAARVGMNAASRELGIARATIARFKTYQPEYWSDLAAGQDVAPKRRQRQAEDLEDLADAYTEREFEALQRAEKLIKTADGKELAALMRAMGASRGLATAGARGHRGEDTQHVEHNINFAQLEQAAQAILARATPAPPILVENHAESTAEDA